MVCFDNWWGWEMIIAAWRRWLHKPIPAVEKLTEKAPEIKRKVKAKIKEKKKEYEEKAKKKLLDKVDKMCADTGVFQKAYDTIGDMYKNNKSYTSTVSSKFFEGAMPESFNAGMRAFDKGMETLNESMKVFDEPKFDTINLVSHKVNMTKMMWLDAKERWKLNDHETLLKILKQNKYDVHKITRAYITDHDLKVVVEFVAKEKREVKNTPSGTSYTGPR